MAALKASKAYTLATGAVDLKRLLKTRAAQLH